MYYLNARYYDPSISRILNEDILLELSKNLDTEYEIGVWSETRDLLERKDNITDFSINYDEGQYNIIIKLQDFDLHIVYKNSIVEGEYFCCYLI